jgi:hypothetical protein
MNSRKVLFAVVAVLAAVPSFASTHVWLGTTSDRISEPSNWSGGSPVGDPDARLLFSADAAQFHVTNDVEGLHFKSAVFETQNYSLTGAPFDLTDASIDSDGVVIDTDLQITGTLTLLGYETLTGVIRGSGGVTIEGSHVTYTGARSNTYSGKTLIRSGVLTLSKGGGATAIAGDVDSEAVNAIGFVVVREREQIANTSTVGLVGTNLQLNQDETIAALDVVDGDVLIGNNVAQATLAVGSLHVSYFAYVTAGLRLESDPEVAAGATLQVSGPLFVPQEGVTLRGPGLYSWSSDYTAPTRVEGARASLVVPNSEVHLAGGSFSGKARSIVATAGSLDVVSIDGDVRLAPGVTLRTHGMSVGGVLDLGGATLDLPDLDVGATPRILILNTSTQPILGTFAGLPEGAIVENRYRVSYVGESGNDVTLTSLGKPPVLMVLSQRPDPVIVGETVTLQVMLSGSSGTPTGTVTFTLDGVVLGTSPVVDGVASIQFIAPDDDLFVAARYSGDAVYISSNHFIGTAIRTAYRKPTITSIDPPSGDYGKVVHLTVRGSNFARGSRVAVTQSTEFVSDTELRAIFDLSAIRDSFTLDLTVVQPDGTRSEPFPFTITAVPDQSAMLSFESRGAVAHVTNGAKTAWLSSAFVHASRFFAVDSDQDGVVIWPLAQFGGIYAVVDLTSGAFDVRAHGALREAAELPPNTFSRDAAGKISLFILPLEENAANTGEILWARAGVGAWSMTLVDGEDLDGAYNRLLIGSVDGMIPYGDSPPHPAEFRTGDVVIAMSVAAGLSLPPRYYASRLGDLSVPAGSPGTLQATQQHFFFSENAGVARLPVIRTGGSAGTASVHYATLDRTAHAGREYVSASGTLTFAPGETLKWIEVPLIDHPIYHGFDGGFFEVVLSDPVGASLGETTVFVVSILNDHGAPQVTIEGSVRNVLETDAPQPATFELTLEGSTTVPAILTWTMVLLRTGTVLQSGVLTFAVGETTKSLTVILPGDNVMGEVAQFEIRFEPVSGALMQGTTIFIHLEEDEGPTIDSRELSTYEGGEARLVFSATPPREMTYDFVTEDGTATAGADYVHTTGEIEFRNSDPDAVAVIPLLDDTLLEGDETFTVRLVGTDVVGHLTIRDDELLFRPEISIAGATVAEADGVAMAAFEVSLSEPSTWPVTARYRTLDDTAIAGIDYQATEETFVFAPGETKKTFLVPVLDDADAEGDETFSVVLTHMLNGQVRHVSAVGTIVSDEGPARRRSTRH